MVDVRAELHALGGGDESHKNEVPPPSCGVVNVVGPGERVTTSESSSAMGRGGGGALTIFECGRLGKARVDADADVGVFGVSRIGDSGGDLASCPLVLSNVRACQSDSSSS